MVKRGLFFFLKSKKGFSVLEVMVASAIGIVIALALANISADVVRAEKSARETTDYISFIQTVQRGVKNARSCDIFGGEFNYNGGAEVTVPFFRDVTRAGTVLRTYNSNQRLPGTTVTLSRLVMERTNGTPATMTLTYNTQPQEFRRHFSYIRVEGLKGSSLGGQQIRAVRVPIVLYEFGGRVRYCGSGAVGSTLCEQMGGAPLINPNTGDEVCDILPAYGGCARGGRYTENVSNNACLTPNPYTDDCNCPSGPNEYGVTVQFVPRLIANYNASKRYAFRQYECLRCSANTPTFDNAAFAGTVFNEDLLYEAIACGYADATQFPNQQERDIYNSLCPCSPNNIGSTGGQQLCSCYENPDQAVCQNPCLFAPGSCSCLSYTYQSLNPGTTAYNTAYDNYVNLCERPLENWDPITCAPNTICNVN